MMTYGGRFARRLLRCATLALTALILVPLTVLAQGPGTEDGSWTYLGGDAWHTRYTPSDEITAENFSEVTELWLSLIHI